mmetsp:Transcript_22783/g.52037  ORF Transcript_22783/g.52037 Transcript_22783/m.52037 type:complete len:855 (+) Transcript_22783:49-2613(+)
MDGAEGKTRLRPEKIYEELKHLGSGAFGAAVLVRRRCDGRRYVAKKCCIEELDEKQRKLCLEEVALLRKVQHPCVAEVADFRWASRNHLKYWIVLKYYPGGDVQQQIDNCKELDMEIPVAKAGNWITQLCMALDYVHNLKIVHRDVKGSNIFITGADNVVLGDFGASKQLTASVAKAMTSVGSPVFMAPEWWDGRGGTSLSDMWSVGVVLYELIALRRPFEAGNVLSLVNKVTSEDPAPLPEDVDDSAKQLIHTLLTKDAQARCSAYEALRSPFLKRYFEILGIYRGPLEKISDKQLLQAARAEDAAKGLSSSLRSEALGSTSGDLGSGDLEALEVAPLGMVNLVQQAAEDSWGEAAELEASESEDDETDDDDEDEEVDADAETTLTSDGAELDGEDEEEERDAETTPKGVQPAEMTAEYCSSMQAKGATVERTGTPTLWQKESLGSSLRHCSPLMPLEQTLSRSTLASPRLPSSAQEAGGLDSTGCSDSWGQGIVLNTTTVGTAVQEATAGLAGLEVTIDAAPVASSTAGGLDAVLNQVLSEDGDSGTMREEQVEAKKEERDDAEENNEEDEPEPADCDSDSSSSASEASDLDSDEEDEAGNDAGASFEEAVDAASEDASDVRAHAKASALTTEQWRQTASAVKEKYTRLISELQSPEVTFKKGKPLAKACGGPTPAQQAVASETLADEIWAGMSQRAWVYRNTASTLSTLARATQGQFHDNITRKKGFNTRSSLTPEPQASAVVATRTAGPFGLPTALADLDGSTCRGAGRETFHVPPRHLPPSSTRTKLVSANHEEVVAIARRCPSEPGQVRGLEPAKRWRSPSRNAIVAAPGTGMQRWPPARSIAGKGMT